MPAQNGFSQLLNAEGKIVDMPSGVQVEVVRYYTELYNQFDYISAFHDLVCKKLVTPQRNSQLLATVRLEEVEAIVRGANPVRHLV